MNKKPTEEELKDLGDWLAGIVNTPQWQFFGDLIESRMEGMTQKVMQDPGEDPWTRGYICGVHWILKGQPENIIRQTQNTDRDTKTP